MREASKVYDADSRVVVMRQVPKAKILGETRGAVKMIADRESWRILGVQMIGENAAEVINEAALALRLRAKVQDVIDTVHVFPTMAESLKLAAISFFRDVDKDELLRGVTPTPARLGKWDCGSGPLIH